MNSTQKDTLAQVHYFSIMNYVVYGSVILYFGRDLFIPISFAALISFVLYPVCSWMERRGVWRMATILISLIVLMLMLLAVFALMMKQFFDFAQEWPVVQSRLTASLQAISTYFIDSVGVSRDTQLHWLSKATDQTANSLLSIIKQAITFSAFSLVMLLLIPVYVVLILYYRQHWAAILYKIFRSEQQQELRAMLFLTVKTYSNFIKGMGLVYLIVGLLNSTGLLLLGVPHALLFGFVASVLTFIPYVGIIIGSLLPIAMAWITYDSIWYPVGIVAIFTFVQYVEANIIFPFAVSSRLHVNTLAMLIAIFVGGILWGMAGMILFVPFVGIIKLIADHNPKMKTLSMALGTEKA
jgi:predicted PurR-regulated permease PerM